MITPMGSISEPRIDIVDDAHVCGATVLGVLTVNADYEIVEVRVTDHHEQLVPNGFASSGTGHPGDLHGPTPSLRRCRPRCEPATFKTLAASPGRGTASMRGLGITLL